jgi:hypothetical protein
MRMYAEDLTSYSYYLKRPVQNVRNVGWLESKEPFLTGEVDLEMLAKLESIIASSGQIDVHVNRIRGRHPCALSNSCGIISVGNGRETLGSSEIWIPATTKDSFLASPSLIYHYISAHNYLPPKEFSDAIFAFDMSLPFCAEAKYLAAIAGHF